MTATTKQLNALKKAALGHIDEVGDAMAGAGDIRIAVGRLSRRPGAARVLARDIQAFSRIVNKADDAYCALSDVDGALSLAVEHIDAILKEMDNDEK